MELIFYYFVFLFFCFFVFLLFFMDRQIVVKNTNFWGNAKEIKKEQMEMISSYINLGTQFDIQILTKQIENLVLFEYGPVLTLHEIWKFVETLIHQLNILKKYKKELFSQFLNIFSNSGETNYIIKSVCILIRQTPYCILIKFGDINTINYIIDLDVSTLYILGENTNSTPYDESEYPVYEQMYSELKKDFF